MWEHPTHWHHNVSVHQVQKGAQVCEEKQLLGIWKQHKDACELVKHYHEGSVDLTVRIQSQVTTEQARVAAQDGRQVSLL